MNVRFAEKQGKRFIMGVPCIKRHLFLTGEKQIGKSTLLQIILAGQAGRVGGFYTRRTDVCSPGEYAVHLLRVLPNGEAEAPAEENRLFFCSSFGAEQEPADLRNKRFELLGAAALEQAKNAAVSLMIMDELGPNEGEAAAFQAAVFCTLNGEIPVLGVLQRADSDFLAAVAARSDVCVIEVTSENRDALAKELRKINFSCRNAEFGVE